MATWTEIPNTSIETDKPIRAVDGRALRDNPIAITEGATGAPRIKSGGIGAGEVKNVNVGNGEIGAEKFQTGDDERNWVLARTATAVFESVGTYAYLAQTADTAVNISPGNTYAGSSLRTFGYYGPQGSSATSTTGATSTMQGTWRAMGRSVAIGETVRHSLFLRIA